MSLVDVHALKKNEPDPYTDPKRNEPKEKLPLIFRTFNSSNDFPILLSHIILVGNNFGDLD